jgi:hypothetical protein
MVAALLQVPEDFVALGVAELKADGCLVESELGYCAPNFIEAQECEQSDAQRQRESRARRRDRGMVRDRSDGKDTWIQENGSQNVTTGHAGHGVGHNGSPLAVPSRAVPSRAVPSRAVPSEEATGSNSCSAKVVSITPLPGPAPRLPPPAPKEWPEVTLVRDAWNHHRGAELPEWRLTSDKRAKQVKELLARHGIERIVEAVRKLAGSKFATGQTDRGWRANPDWLVRPGSIEKALEGQYDDVEQRSRVTWTGSQADFDNDPYFGPSSKGGST